MLERRAARVVTVPHIPTKLVNLLLCERHPVQQPSVTGSREVEQEIQISTSLQHRFPHKPHDPALPGDGRLILQPGASLAAEPHGSQVPRHPMASVIHREHGTSALLDRRHRFHPVLVPSTHDWEVLPQHALVGEEILDAHRRDQVRAVEMLRGEHSVGEVPRLGRYHWLLGSDHEFIPRLRGRTPGQAKMTRSLQLHALIRYLVGGGVSKRAFHLAAHTPYILVLED